IANNREDALADKHFERVEQRLWIVLTLIHWGRRRAALEQDVDRLPRRADRAFDGEGYFPRNLDVLPDESEIGRSLWNSGRPVAADPGEPDIVNIGHVTRHANRRRHDRGQVPVEPKVPQRLLQDLRAGALIHAFAHKIAVALRIQAVAPPDARAIGFLARTLRRRFETDDPHQLPPAPAAPLPR